MNARITSLETPALRGVILLELTIRNRLDTVQNPAGKVELSFTLTQHVEVGVLRADAEPSVPVVHVAFGLHARKAEAADEAPYLEADARFRAPFETMDNVTHDDWVTYTSSPLARNLALQAIAVCQRIFREQIRLVGIPPERIVFGPLGSFEDRPRKADMGTSRKAAPRAKTPRKVSKRAG